jgi:chromosome segregation ATPase
MSDAISKLATQVPEVAELLASADMQLGRVSERAEDALAAVAEYVEKLTADKVNAVSVADDALKRLAAEARDHDYDVARMCAAREATYALTQRAEKAEAEVAALKARRCETCDKWLPVHSPVNGDLRLCCTWSGEDGADPPRYTSADVSCSFWTEMCP